MIIIYKEVINRMEISEITQSIKEGVAAKEVRRIREVYHLMKPERLPDGQVTTDFCPDIRLPRICFAAKYENRNKKRRIISYNGLVVLELNGLYTYEKAVSLRNLASRMPETLMAFLGGSGKSVKIVCRGEVFGEGSGYAKDEMQVKNVFASVYAVAQQEDYMETHKTKPLKNVHEENDIPYLWYME